MLKHVYKNTYLGLAVGFGLAIIAMNIGSALHRHFTERSVLHASDVIVTPDMTPDHGEAITAGRALLDKEMSEPVPQVADSAVLITHGRFRDADTRHRGSGSATVYRLPDGSLLLRLEDFRVTSGPSLHVLLSSHSDPASRDDLESRDYVDLGKLKDNIGDQSYEIPDIDLSALGSVVIYFKPFRVVFSVAPLSREET